MQLIVRQVFIMVAAADNHQAQDQKNDILSEFMKSLDEVRPSEVRPDQKSFIGRILNRLNKFT